MTIKKTKTLHFVVDADSLLYRIGSRYPLNQYKITVDEEYSFIAEKDYDTSSFDEFHIPYVIEHLTAPNITSQAKADFTEIVNLYINDARLQMSNLTGSSYREGDRFIFLGQKEKHKTFRHNIYPNYKANRKSKPEQFGCMHDAFLQAFPDTVIVNPDFEADDICADKFKALINLFNEDQAVLVAMDKDFLQIPGYHYNYKNKILDSVDSFEAAYSFCDQMLAGDGADNIKGLPGIGPKKSALILSQETTITGLYQVTREAYIDQYGDCYNSEFLLHLELLYLGERGLSGENNDGKETHQKLLGDLIREKTR